MKRSLICIAMLLLLSGINQMAASETYHSGCFEGNAPISVDGDFSDWENFSIIPLQVSTVSNLSQPGLPRNESDLSASFRCLSDNDNIFIAMNIQDDILIFGEAPVGIPFQDDCVEVLVFGSQIGFPPIKIWVSNENNGNVKLEGREPQENKSYPFIWTKQGIGAALKKNSKGYHVEMKIPKTVLGLVGLQGGDVTRMNVRVYDDDNGGSFESIIQWAGNSEQAFNEIAFDEILTLPNAESQELTQEIEIVIESPDQSQEPVDPSVQYDLALAYERAGLYSEAIIEIQKAINIVSEGELKNKIKLTLARNYFFIGEYDKAKTLCKELLNVENDSKRILDTNMILLSVDRKQSNLIGQ